jgi:formylglycine-generating enzyme required for sulfatase activity
MGPDLPVPCVSWNDIAGPDGFIERLNNYLGTTRFRLPTEAEWEMAARAGTQTRFSYGDALDPPCDEDCGFCDLHDQHIVWCGNDGNNKAKQVGSRDPNPFGLHDIHGNVHEWVQDWYVQNLGTEPQTDPTGPLTGEHRVMRTGSWFNYAYYCRSANRSFNPPDYRSNTLGFRIAMSD